MFHVITEYLDRGGTELIPEVTKGIESVEDDTNVGEAKASTVIVDLSRQGSLNSVETAAGYQGQDHQLKQLSHHVLY